MYEVGQTVKATKNIYEPADECHPGGYLALKGDILIVRRLGTHFPVYVSHETVLDNSFGANLDEIELA